MKIEKLFNVLVVTGAATTVGIAACGTAKDAGPPEDGTTGGSAGSSSSGGSSGGKASGGSAGSSSKGGSAGTSSSGGSDASGGSGGGGDACAAQCEPGCASDWINCNGCCCWLAPGKAGACGPVGCPETETCCP